MDSFNKLKIKFEEIKKKGYIPSKYKDLGYAGKTFENQLGKRLNNYQRADFEDIEIKVKNDKSVYPISLFGITPQIKNKEYKNSIEYLFKNFSFYNENNNKIFICEIKGNRYTRTKNGYWFKGFVDYKSKKIILKIAEEEYGIESNIYWLFNGIEKRLIKKMSKMAIVDAKVKTENNTIYCYYYNITFYELKDTDTFFKLFEKGIIKIEINIRLKDNEIKCDGVKFRIKYEDIDKLFNKIN